MATIEAKNASHHNNLAKIKRIEALSARAWPAEQEIYDGLFVKRITKNYASSRLNSVTPLDPKDDKNIKDRIKKLCFDTNGVFERGLRITPLSPQAVCDFVKVQNWTLQNDVVVMTLSLDRDSSLENIREQSALAAIDIELIPAEEYVAQSLHNQNALNEKGDKSPSAFLNILQRIKGKASFLAIKYKNENIGNMLLVDDFDHIGILDFNIHHEKRLQGFGIAAMHAALIHIMKDKKNTFKTLWLQVEKKNIIARHLYKKLHFTTIYDYQYWICP